MANISKTIDIIFNGKDQVSGPADRVVKAIKAIEPAIDKTVDVLDDMADKFKTAMAAAAAFGTVIGTYVTVKFKEFESAWIDLQKIIEPTIDNLDEADEQIQDLALQYGVGMTEITRSTIEFKRAGFSLVESLQLVEGGLQLASAGNVDMATSTEFIVAIMKGFNFQLEDSENLINVLNVASDKYATNVKELGVALSRIAPTAKTAGLSLEETTGLAVPIIEVFRSGEEAGTALRRALIKLTDDSKPVKEALRSLGVSQTDANGQLRSGRDILYDIADAFGDATEGNKLLIASQLFGQRQAAKLIKVLEDWNYVMSIKSTVAAEDFQYTLDQVALKLNSTEVAINRTISALELTAIRIGFRIKPAIDEAFSGMADALTKLSDDIKQGLTTDLFDTFTDFGKQLGDYFRALGDILPGVLSEIDYSGLIASFKALLGTINESFGAIDLTEPENLAEAIQFVVDAMESGIVVATGMVEKYKNVASVILESIRAFNGLDEGQKRTFGGALATADVMEYVGKIFGLLITNMEAFAGIAGTVITSVGAMFSLIGAEIDLFKSLVIDQFTSMAKWILRALNWATLGASDTIKENLKLVTEAHKLARAEIDTDAQEMANAYNTIINSLRGLSRQTTDTTKIISTSSEKNTKSVESSIDRQIRKINEYIAKQEEIPEQVITELSVALDDDEIDPAVKEMAERITKANQEFAARSKFKADVELDSEAKDLIDFMSGQGKYKGQEIGVFTDEDLGYLETRLASMRKELAVTGEAVEDATDVELDVPDDEKFKASQERLLKEIDTNAQIVEASMEAYADVAESRAETVSSAFESISSSVVDTGDTLRSLFSELATGRLDLISQSRIQRQIEEEEQRRQEAFDLQKQLTQAQIDLIQQRSAAMAAGDPIVTVSGDGLQPHLEAFMWEILSAIQVRVNEDYGAFLLGIGAS